MQRSFRQTAALKGTELKHWRMPEPDVVFHLAAKYIAQHRPDDIPTLISDNVEMTAKLCEAMTRQLRLQERSYHAGTAGQHAGSPSGEIHTFVTQHVVCGNQASSGRDDRLLRTHNGAACDHAQRFTTAMAPAIRVESF